MSILFYGSALIAVLSTLMVITRVNIVHALLYLIVSMFSIAVIFYTLGAPFAAALEVIVYAGAIMVMFLFVIMMLNLGQPTIDQERSWLSPNMWIGPGILAAILLAEMLYALNITDAEMAHTMVEAKEVGIAMFGPYVLAVELASMLLLAGLVGAFHLARK
ncbi:MAG: NADH-quinone oxidoreductase subunit J [Gammaproteobacteria bacterium]|nr:NADH-quinone oxidoreductase subunit J [Gammaproteobacteria bacterium]MAY01667.1 NADH-quinone oxidoreductase subunit J [Gammaproteobacteria bacterium]|tara:strand:+ start:1204 stop:1686 length:483 start_codon:yes stop_codon:yes gene_type:complete